MESGLGDHHSGQLHREAEEARAERIVGQELSRRGWSEADLEQRRRNDPEKLAIATRLRRETPLTVKAIAGRVHLGASKGANGNLHRYMQANPSSGAIAEPAVPPGE